ncbi:MAG: molybdate transport system substrate-binding protein [Arenicella sp.]
MIKFKICRIFLIVIMFFCASCGGTSSTQGQLTIAVASNMQIAMQEIAERFTALHSIRIEVASASSGVLSAQIMQGAPFDVFVSANMRYPNALKENGETLGAAKIYAYGTLILWSLDGTDVSKGIAALNSASVTHFAIANPETAPYGIATIQALETSGLMGVLKDKMIIGESIAQVNQYVSSGAVQVGLTSSSVLYSPIAFSLGKHQEVDRALYRPIEQGVIILKNGADKNLEAANLFLEYMFSATAKSILNSHGYRATET